MKDQLTLFAEDTLVSRSHLPGDEKAREMTATSGQLCLSSSKSTGPLGLLEKTLLATSQWASTTCFLTWGVKTTPAGRLLFQLAPLVPRTGETEFGLWPTVTIDSTSERTGKYAQGGTPLTVAAKMWPTPRANDGEKRGEIANDPRNGLPAAARFWPTPNAMSNDKTPCISDAEKAWKGEPRANGDKVQARLQDAAAYWPTPTSSMHKGSSKGAMTRKSGASRENDRLDYKVERGNIDCGRLNPTWVESHLMGYRMYWTVLEEYPAAPRRKARQQDEDTD